MEEKRYLNRCYPYLINYCEDGYYLTDNHGFILKSEELMDIGQNLIRFAKKHNKSILEYNKEKGNELHREIASCYKTTKKTPKGYIYIMECGEKYKIGLSKNIERRKKELDNRPFPVNIIYKSKLIDNVYKIEEEIHSHFKEKQINGEWFDLNENDIRVIKEYLEII